MHIKTLLFVAALLGAIGTAPLQASSICCAGPVITIADDIRASDVVITAVLVQRIAAPEDDPRYGDCLFDVLSVVKGKQYLAGLPQVDGATRITLKFFGEQPLGSKVFACAIDPLDLAWGSPTVMKESGIEYVTRLPSLPASGAERLAFFYGRLGDEDPIVAADGNDELSRLDDATLRMLKPHLRHDDVVRSIQDKSQTVARRRLFMRLLAVCGTADDLPLLEAMIREENRETVKGLDATIATYLTLRGPAGMPLVEELFLKNPAAQYTEIYSAITALRNLRDYSEAVPRERLLEGFRALLENPVLADLVVADLAKAQDWESMDRLVKLFKEADEDSMWVRVPVVHFLRLCPLPEAKKHLEELTKIDPEAVAKSMRQFQPPANNPATIVQ
ncbi:MAG: hypothetical protein QM775_02075 [Pirellulales bacterium]